MLTINGAWICNVTKCDFRFLGVMQDEIDTSGQTESGDERGPDDIQEKRYGYQKHGLI